MSKSRWFCLALVASAVILPSTAKAQGPSSTGLGALFSADPNWTFSLNGGSFGTAYILDRTPNSPGNYMWIGATATGTVPGGAPDGNFARDLYTVSTTFNGGTATGFKYLCSYDDAVLSIILNGSNLGTGTCNAYTLGSEGTITGLNAGSNTLLVNYEGNGVTDGIVFDVTAVIDGPQSVVPEPGTWSLFATGLMGLGLVTQRRRRA